MKLDTFMSRIVWLPCLEYSRRTDLLTWKFHISRMFLNYLPLIQSSKIKTPFGQSLKGVFNYFCQNHWEDKKLVPTLPRNSYSRKSVFDYRVLCYFRWVVLSSQKCNSLARVAYLTRFRYEQPDCHWEESLWECKCASLSAEDREE